MDFDRFYYNLGDFFMEMDEHAGPDLAHFREIGQVVGQFYLGLMETVGTEIVALTLAEKFMELQSDGEIEFTPDDEDGEELA